MPLKLLRHVWNTHFLSLSLSLWSTTFSSLEVGVELSSSIICFSGRNGKWEPQLVLKTRKTRREEGEDGRQCQRQSSGSIIPLIFCFPDFFIIYYSLIKQWFGAQHTSCMYLNPFRAWVCFTKNIFLEYWPSSSAAHSLNKFLGHYIATNLISPFKTAKPKHSPVGCQVQVSQTMLASLSPVHFPPWKPLSLLGKQWFLHEQMFSPLIPVFLQDRVSHRYEICFWATGGGGILSVVYCPAPPP